jgi:hypothetical protein
MSTKCTVIEYNNQRKPHPHATWSEEKQCWLIPTYAGTPYEKERRMMDPKFNADYVGFEGRGYGDPPKVVTDFFGQNLEIGDEVAFEEPGYRNLVKGTIVSFTPKQMNVEWTRRSDKVMFRIYPQDCVLSPKKALKILNEVYEMVPIEVSDDDRRLTEARNIIKAFDRKNTKI